MDSDWRHPAEKALHVLKPVRAQTLDSIRPGLRLVKYSRQQRPRLAEKTRGDTYPRLLRLCDNLPDPMLEALYPGTKWNRALSKPKHHEQGNTLGGSPIQIPTCCSQHKVDVKYMVKENQRLLYNSARPKLYPSRHLPSRLQAQTIATIKANRRQLPLSTVVVRWHNSPNRKPLNVDAIYDVMSEFGPITAIDRNQFDTSANVVYLNLSDSCSPVQEKTVGPPGRRFYCHWLHKCMDNKKFVGTGTRLRVKHDIFLTI